MTNYEMIKSLSIEEMAMFMERVKMNKLNSSVFACRGSRLAENMEWLEEKCSEDDDDFE